MSIKTSTTTISTLSVGTVLLYTSYKLTDTSNKKNKPLVSKEISVHSPTYSLLGIYFLSQLPGEIIEKWYTEFDAIILLNRDNPKLAYKILLFIYHYQH
jgi:hypothetical protein